MKESGGKSAEAAKRQQTVRVVGYTHTKEEADTLYNKLFHDLTRGGMDEEAARFLAATFTPAV